MNTGFAVELYYNEATDADFSPNGDYVRVKPQAKSNRRITTTKIQSRHK